MYYSNIFLSRIRISSILTIRLNCKNNGIPLASMIRTWIEINKNNFYHNITALERLVHPARLALVLKSNAYGHGLEQIGILAQAHPSIDFLCTISLQEAQTLRATGVTKPILVLTPTIADLHTALKQNITCTLYDKKMIDYVCTQKNLAGLRVHIKIDTGMSRLGIPLDNAIDCIRKLAHTQVSLEGLFTHISDKDNPCDDFSHQQLQAFEYIINRLKQENIHIPLVHSLSSGALEYSSLYTHSHIRAGTNFYGFWTSQTSKNRMIAQDPLCDLRPILTWKTHIAELKEVAPGSCIGYNRTAIAQKNMRIALLPVGYADGYPRALSNKSSVMINGHYAPVIGIISMNLMTIDITLIPNVTLDTIVTLVGDAPHISAQDLAALDNTIHIEFTTHINPHIPRKLL